MFWSLLSRHGSILLFVLLDTPRDLGLARFGQIWWRFHTIQLFELFKNILNDWGRTTIKDLNSEGGGLFKT